MNTLIITVINERNNLNRWIESILSQSVLPDEIVVVDGGSSDGTMERLVEISKSNQLIKVFKKHGNISTGRNYAIHQASGDLIIVTDAGCIYDKDWFKKLLKEFSDPSVQIAATGFGPWLEKTDGLLLYLIASATTPAKSEFTKDWLPSSRSVAFKKNLWQQVDGYPEWIPICEDVIFDLKLKKTGSQIKYIREPLVFWRPRTCLKLYFKQLYKYTKSDGHGKLWLHRQIIRYFVYLSSVLLLLATIYSNYLYLIVLLLGIALYIKKFWQRFNSFGKELSIYKKISGYLLMPFIIALGDVGKMGGWPVGVYERLIGKIKFEKYI